MWRKRRRRASAISQTFVNTLCVCYGARSITALRSASRMTLKPFCRLSRRTRVAEADLHERQSTEYLDFQRDPARDHVENAQASISTFTGRYQRGSRPGGVTIFIATLKLPSIVHYVPFRRRRADMARGDEVLAPISGTPTLPIWTMSCSRFVCLNYDDVFRILFWVLFDLL